MHFSIPLCHTSMHCWKYSSGMPLGSIVTALLMASRLSKQVPLMIPMSLGKRKKVTRSKIRWIGRLFQYGQELPDAQGNVSRCSVVVKQSGFVLPQLSSLLAHWAMQKLQDLFVDLQVDRLALWQELTVDDASDIEEHDQHDSDFWFWLSCFPLHCPLTALALGFWVIIKNPCLVTSDDSMKQAWFSLKTLNDVLTHLHAALLLVFIQQHWHHFCTLSTWEKLYTKACETKFNGCRKLGLQLYTPKISC